MRILLFLYSDTIERNTEAGIALRRRQVGAGDLQRAPGAAAAGQSAGGAR